MLWCVSALPGARRTQQRLSGLAGLAIDMQDARPAQKAPRCNCAPRCVCAPCVCGRITRESAYRTPPRSRVFEESVLKVGQGDSIANVVRQACASKADGAHRDELDAICELKDDQYRQETRWHSLCRKLLNELTEPYEFVLDLLSPLGKPVPTKVSCILIWEMVDALSEAGKTQLQMSMFGSYGHLGPESWWKEAVSSGLFDSHPGARTRPAPIPLLIYSDGVEIFRNDSWEVFSFQSLLHEPLHAARESPVPMNVLDVNFLMFMIPAGLIPDKARFASQVADFLAWQATVLLEGRWPSHGYYGEPLTGRRAELAASRFRVPSTIVAWHGDCKARRDINLFERYWKCSQMCDSCLATNAGPLTFRDFNGPWRETAISHETYLSMCRNSGSSTSPLLRIPGVRKEHILFDISHVLHLGVARDALGSFAVLLAESGALRGWIWHKHGVKLRQTKDGKNEQLVWLWAAFKRFVALDSRDGSTRGRNPFVLRCLGRLGPSSFPELPTWVKASRCKKMADFFAEVMPEIAGYGLEGDACDMLLACSWALSKYEHVLQSAEGRTWLGGRLQERAVQSGWLFLLSYQWLSTAFADNCLFHLRPKFHYLAHIHDMLVRYGFNPAAACCLNSESFNGFIKRVAKHTHARTTGLRCVQRYLDYLHLRWQLRVDGRTEPAAADCLDILLQGER